jgi:hypothetical protein
MKNSNYLILGVVGFVIVLALNCYANIFLAQPAAIPFQSSWYSTWFPNYIIWFVFLSIGIAKYSRNKCT